MGKETMTKRQRQAAVRRQAKFDADIKKPEGTWDRREAEGQARGDEYEARRIEAHNERKAIAAARKAAEPVRDKHCQVCGRDIMANTGTIAHHGYTRPQGWYSQTASCPGALHVPYEESCEKLKEVARGVQVHIEATIAKREAINEAPAKLTYKREIRRNFRVSDHETVTLERPSDFEDGDLRYHLEGSYQAVLRNWRANLESEVRLHERIVKEMNGRIAAWKS